MEKLTKFDDQVSHLFLSICEKVNEIVDYINKQQLAASGSDTSRTTPNPEKGSEIENLFKLYNLKIDDYIYSRLIEALEILFQANGETPAMDNPVAPLDIISLAKKYLPGSNNKSYTFLESDLIKFANELIECARTTDKEQLKFTESEYNLICKGLNLLGVTSGRVFYVLNRSVKKVDDTV